MFKLKIFMLVFWLLPITLWAKINVVSSTSDLAYFAREIGGEHVVVTSIASPKTDVHFVEVRPSYMIKVARADVALKVGLELDMWMDRIIDGSRNDDLGIVDCSRYIRPLEVPTFKADARYGDLHRYGNPHYWIGPQNVRAISDAIVEGLTAAAPEHAEAFQKNRELLLADLDLGLTKLEDKVRKLSGAEVIYYHNSWPYFNEYAGIEAVDFIEPYPGVPPSPSHIKELIDICQARQLSIIAVEPYFDKRVPRRIAEESNAAVVTLYPSVGGRDEKETYLEWLEGNLDALIEALK